MCYELELSISSVQNGNAYGNNGIRHCGYGELYEGYDTRECKTLPIEQAYSLLEYLYGN